MHNDDENDHYHEDHEDYEHYHEDDDGNWTGDH